MAYTLPQISDILLKSDRTMYRLGSIAYENMFSEDSEDVDYERDIIYIYKVAVEYADNFYVGTDKLDTVVEKLAAKIAVYDFGQLTPIYSDATIVTQSVPAGAALDDLSDVTITNVQNNQTLRYSSSLGQWINVGPGAAVRNRQQFTATLNQTVFVTTFPFESGLLDVYLNGVKLSPPSYTTFGNYTITLADGSLVDDIVEVIAYDPATSFIDLSGYVPTSRTLTINGVTYDLSANRSWTITAGLSSIGLSMPSGFTVTNSPLTANGTITVTGAGTTAQYIRGDGTLATFPTLTGYVPYTGATATVDLGDNDLEAGSVFVEGATGAGGALRIKQFGSSAANLNGYSTISTLNTGVFYFTAAATAPNFKNFVLNPSGLTDNTLRTYTLPNLSGTLALLSDIPSLTGFVPYTGATTNVNLGEFELKAGQMTLDITPTGTAAVGTTRWNDTIGSSETTLKGGSVILKNGVDLVARVVNKVTPNATLTKAAYQAVRVSGAQGQMLAVAYAQANNDANSADTIGLVTETIATNQEGFIITVGQIEEINTTGSLQGETWVDGDVLYLSPFTPGAITKVKPTGNGHIVVIGYVEYAHAIHGKIYVKVMNGWELDELHDVSIVTPANNEALIYESSTSLWKNKTIATALGYTPISGSGTAGQVAYWNGTNSQTGSNNLFWNNTLTNLGIGFNNINTAWKLGVAGNVAIEGFLSFGSVVGSASNAYIQVSSTELNIYAHTSRILSFYANAAERARITTGGNLLLNTTTDGGQRLQVQGTALITGNTEISAGNLSIFTTNTPRRINLQVANGSKAAAIGIEAGGVIHSVIGADTTGNDFLQVASRAGIAFYSGSTIGNIVTDPTNERMRLTTAGRLLLGITTESTFLLDVNGTARVSGATYLATSSGNVGIGTTSPGEKLTINGYIGLQYSGTQKWHLGADSSNNLSFVRSGIAERMVLNSDGNLGLGVTPSAWSGLSGKVFEFGTAFGDKGSIFQNDIDDLRLMSNVYFDGSFRYVRTGTATIFHSINGSYRWSTAPSGTAGNAISFTQAMTLTGGGNLLVGTTTDAGFKLDVNGTARVGGSSASAQLYLKGGVGNGQYLYFDDGGSNLWTIVGASIFAIDSSSTRIFRANANAQVTINGSSVNATAQLQVDSTTRGFLPPRMTNAQRTAISSPAVGLIVYCTDATEGLYQYINNAWVNLTGVVTNRQTASYTLALGDSNDLVEMNVATANNLTVPLNSSVAFPIGTKIDIAQYGAGQTTVVATSGVTVRSAGGALKLAVQYSGASLVKIGTDEWYLFGDITV